MNKMDFDSALRRQVMSLPELMRQQYADLEPKTRTVLSTPEIFNIQRIVLTGCGDSYAALLAVGGGLELGDVQLQDALGALPQHGFLMPGDAQRERARLAAAANRLPYARHLPGVRHGDDQRTLRRIAEVLLLVVAR